MIPIPQYPLYTASITLYGGAAVPYFLEEEADWGTSLQGLEESFAKARSQGMDVRALCVINPGNPTGQCLTKDNIVEVIDMLRAKIGSDRYKELIPCPNLIIVDHSILQKREACPFSR